MRTFEDLITDTGGLGKFQMALMACVQVCLVMTGWSMLQMSFGGLIPDYYCHTDDVMTANTTGNTSTMNVCEVNGTSCSSFMFIGQRRTVISEWDLVCDRKWAKQIIISVQMGGVLIGCMLIGQMSDTFGRRKSLYFINMYHIVVNVVTAFSTSWIMFAVLRFFVGIGIGGIFVVAFTYPMEFLPVKWRILMASLPFWPSGVSLFALGASIMEDWVHLHFACAILCVPSMFGVFFVPESIRWLTLQGRLDEAEKVFTRIATTNGTEVPSDVMKVLENVRDTEIQSQDKPQSYTYLDLFKSWKMAKNTLVAFVWWLNVSMMYYGISFGVSSLSGSVYLNIFLMALIEFPFRASTAFFCNTFGRRPTARFFFAMATLLSLCLLLTQTLVPEVHRGSYISWFSLFALAMTGASWASIQTWTSEMYPTVMRNLGYGWANTAARVGGIAAPFLLNFDDIPLVSYSIMVTMFLLCTLLTVVPPETKDQVLKDSVDNNNGSS